MKLKQTYVILLACLAVTAAVTNPAGQRWWNYVRELASDKYAGRETASQGYRQAAEYVAAEFKRFGLKPAGASGFTQSVPLSVRRIRENESSLTLVQGGVQELLQLGEDAYFNLAGEPAASLQAPAVFVGYGLTAPEVNYDDLAGIDLQGRVAVFLRGGPASIPGPLRVHYQSMAEQWAFLRRAGAIGMVSILNPRSMDIPWDRLKPRRLQSFMALADSKLDETTGLRLAVTVNPASADRLLIGTGHSMSEIMELAEAGKSLPRFPLAGSIRTAVSFDRSEAASDNVAAMLPGRDPKLRNEYVVVSAHLDHLGIGEPIDGDSLYNGAMDDASGVASLFEIARLLRAAPPRRSVLFLAVTGEEKGLLGSKYFAAYPMVKPGAIVADLNMDMFLPLHRLRLLTVLGMQESTLGADVGVVARAFGVTAQLDPQPERNLFTRSDQYSFIRAGIPSLAFKFGFAPGSAQARLQAEWLRNRYHAPSDNDSQPVDLAAAAKFNRFIASLAARIANRAARPQWNQNSFFRRFVRSGG